MRGRNLYHVDKKDIYDFINQKLDEFLELPSLRKIASLSDFTYDLKIFVDKSGLVQRIEKING